MAVAINSIKYIPDLPAAKPLAPSDLLHISQAGMDGQLGLNALTAYLTNILHPVGSLLMSQRKGWNPNTLFPGQTWVRWAQGANLRGCADDESNIAGVTGADTMTLQGGHMPSHAHGVNIIAQSNGTHSHSGYTTTNGDHTHSAWTDTQGQHSHNLAMTGSDDGNSGGNSLPATGRDSLEVNTSHPIDYQGAHGHNVGIGAAGNHNHYLNINAAGEHGHNVVGQTGNAGSNVPFSIVPRSVFVACWVRTA